MTTPFRVAVLALAVACLCPGAMASAQTNRTSQGGVPYVSGGVGDEEIAAMRAMAGQYNLKLEFALTGGDFLSDVRVMLRGPVNLDAVSDGPLFMAKVPPGLYRVTVTCNGVAKTRQVTVGATGQKAEIFLW
jgi:3-deoxy-D-manno-octulosonate 8-phosphate phosphatase KdsC-like HAD superfamily phosphatase